MCEPATILLALSTVVGAGGAIGAGKQQKEMAAYNAKVAEQAAIAERGAGAVREFGIRQEVRRAMSGMQAENAKSGFALTGTPLTVAAEAARAGELDALTVRAMHINRAQNFSSQADLERAGGQAAQTAGYVGAATSLLRGGVQAYSMGAFSGGSSSSAGLDAWTRQGPG